MSGRYLAGLLFLAAMLACQTATANASTRSLKFYNLHTHERAQIVYKRNGRYDQGGLRKINHFLRDWRENKEVKMNPRLLDLIWEVYRESGSRDYINVICGYRSPKTNSMLRSRSNGVAKKSQHMLGNALDFYIPDVKLAKLRAIALKLQDGGVGYYPTSGSPFVHLDVAHVRHWPRMSRRQLVSLFPDGKTLHVPTDGKPLPGYKQAKAAYQSRVSSGRILMADSESGGSAGRSGGGLLASIFGGGDDEEDDSIDAVPSARPTRTPKTTTARKAPVRLAEVPDSAVTKAEAEPQPAKPSTILAALPARALPLPRPAPRPEVAVGAGQQVAMASLSGGAASKAESTLPGVAGRSAASSNGAEAGKDKTSKDGGDVSDALLALSVPLPTWRPAYAPEPAKSEETVLADAGPSAKPEPVARPENTGVDDTAAGAESAIDEILKNEKKTVMASTASAYLPVPSFRPEKTLDQPAVASVTGVVKPIIDADNERRYVADALAGGSIADGKSSRRASGSPRLAMLSRQSAEKPLTIITSGVKTTSKGGRLKASDLKAKPRAVAVPIKADSARWALTSDQTLSNAGETTKRPAFDSALVRSPDTVYTTGFQQGFEVADARRFKGTAVKFFSVARFATN